MLVYFSMCLGIRISYTHRNSGWRVCESAYASTTSSGSRKANSVDCSSSWNCLWTLFFAGGLQMRKRYCWEERWIERNRGHRVPNGKRRRRRYHFHHRIPFWMLRGNWIVVGFVRMLICRRIIRRLKECFVSWKLSLISRFLMIEILTQPLVMDLEIRLLLTQSQIRRHFSWEKFVVFFCHRMMCFYTTFILWNVHHKQQLICMRVWLHSYRNSMCGGWEVLFL